MNNIAYCVIIKKMIFDDLNKSPVKKIFFLFAAALINVATAQTLPNTFKIGSYAEILPGDSLKVWISPNGITAKQQCADFYRVGKIDTVGVTLINDFKDFYVNGKLMFEATMINGRL
ncbi:MAG: hypothetical protein EOP51_32040, partial [Sphingobacteriales bacterium]